MQQNTPVAGTGYLSSELTSCVLGLRLPSGELSIDDSLCEFAKIFHDHFVAKIMLLINTTEVTYRLKLIATGDNRPCLVNSKSVSALLCQNYRFFIFWKIPFIKYWAKHFHYISLKIQVLKSINELTSWFGCVRQWDSAGRLQDSFENHFRDMFLNVTH